MKKSKLELKGVSNDYRPVYIWPESGDVDCCDSRHSNDENGMICDVC